MLRRLVRSVFEVFSTAPVYPQTTIKRRFHVTLKPDLLNLLSLFSAPRSSGLPVILITNVRVRPPNFSAPSYCFNPLNKQTSALRNFSTASISLETVIVRTTKSDLRSHWSFCVCCHSVISTALSRSVHVNTPNISQLPIAATRNRQPDRERICTHACGVGKALTDQVATLVSFKALVQQ